MTKLILPPNRVYTQQPQKVVPLDKQYSGSDSFAWTPQGVSTPKGTFPYTDSGVPINARKNGLGKENQFLSGRCGIEIPRKAVRPGNITYIVCFTLLSTTEGKVMAGVGNNGTPDSYVEEIGTINIDVTSGALVPGKFRFVLRSQNGNIMQVGSTNAVLSVGNYYEIVFITTSNTTARCFVNGIEIAVSYGTNNYSYQSAVFTKPFTICTFNYGSSTSGYADVSNNGPTGLVPIFSVSMVARLDITPNIALELVSNPWKIFDTNTKQLNYIKPGEVYTPEPLVKLARTKVVRTQQPTSTTKSASPYILAWSPSTTNSVYSGSVSSITSAHISGRFTAPYFDADTKDVTITEAQQVMDRIANGPITIVTLVDYKSNSRGIFFGSGHLSSTGGNGPNIMAEANGQIDFIRGGAGGLIRYACTNPISTGVRLLIWSHAGGVSDVPLLYVDGVATATTSVQVDASINAYISGSYGAGSDALTLTPNFTVGMIGVLNRVITPQEASSISKNPWQLFAPVQKTIPILPTKQKKPLVPVTRSSMMGTTQAPKERTKLLVPQYRRPLTQQPQNTISINWSNPIAKGLLLLATPFSRMSTRPSIIYGRQGAAGQGGVLAGPPVTAGVANSTLLVVESRLTPDDGNFWQANAVVYRDTAAGWPTHSGILMSSMTAYGNVIFGAIESGGLNTKSFSIDVTPTGTVVPGQVLTRAVTVDSSLLATAYGDGISYGTSTALQGFTYLPPPLNSAGPAFGAQSAGVPDSATHMHMVARWDRCLSAQEIAQVSANPWQLFAPAKKPLFVPT